MLLKHIKVVFLLLLSFKLFSQSDSQFSQYMFNGLVVNPAIAGSKENISTNFLVKKQWLGIKETPMIESFNIHSPFKYQRIGLGLQITNETFGIQNRFSASAAYSYKINLGKGILSFGISAGIIQSSIKYSLLKILEDERDNHPDINITNPDLGTGLYYQSDKFYVGISSLHLIESGLSYSNRNNKIDLLRRHYYAMAGYKFKISDKLYILPSTLIKYIESYQFQIDLTSHIKYEDLFWVGASWRSSETYSFQAGVKLSDIISLSRQGIKIGYAYDWSNKSIDQLSRGSHEIMIILDLNIYQNPSKIKKGKINISPVLF